MRESFVNAGFNFGFGFGLVDAVYVCVFHERIGCCCVEDIVEATE